MIVVVCLFLRYVCLFTMPETSEKYVIRCLLQVIGEHGVFRSILSDNGPPYSGIMLKALANHLQINQKLHLLTIPNPMA